MKTNSKPAFKGRRKPAFAAGPKPAFVAKANTPAFKERTADRKVSSREVALNVVRDVFGEHPRGAHDALDYRSRTAELDPRDRAFATELAYGSIKMRRRLDFILEPFIGERIKSMPPTIVEVLRLGAYQLDLMNGVEVYAAVSESVGLAKRYGHKGTAGLTNAVLRRVAEAVPVPVHRGSFETDDDYLGTRYSLPNWIVAHWRARFGSERLEAILAGINAPAPAGLRIDPKLDRAAIVIELAADGIIAHASPLVRDAIVIADGHASSRLAERANGRWNLQAESACMPVDLLDPQPNERILELCSGRGNKTLQIVGRTGDTGTLEAIDNDERKVELDRKRLAEHGFASVTLECADATIPRGADDMDRVLVDAPCSGLGILGRQPEARWRKASDDGARLAPLQRAILEAGAKRLRARGTLVYAVCSSDAREGDGVVDGFLGANAQFTRAAAPERYADFLTPAGDVLVPPGIDGRDGFYIATLTRT